MNEYRMHAALSQTSKPSWLMKRIVGLKVNGYANQKRNTVLSIQNNKTLI